MKHVFVFALSIAFRFILMILGSEKWLSERVEVATPLDSLTQCDYCGEKNATLPFYFVHNYYSARRRGSKEGGAKSL